MIGVEFISEEIFVEWCALVCANAEIIKLIDTSIPETVGRLLYFCNKSLVELKKKFVASGRGCEEREFCNYL